MVLPMPSVPALHPVENWIDLVQLGTSDLATYIYHPDIADSSFWINWRGCDAQGNVVDVFDIEYSVIGDPGPDGVQVLIDNADVQALDQGYVFYSYRIESTTVPGQQGEESLRRFFMWAPANARALSRRWRWRSSSSPTSCRSSWTGSRGTL